MSAGDREQAALSTAVSERLEGALESIDRERDVLDTEIEAFRAFGKRLESIPVEESVATARSVHADSALVDRSDSRSAGAAVRDAYVNTVMSVPHYEEEYGESYWESLAAELGTELSMALRQSPSFSRMLKAQLQTAVREATASRKRMRTLLDQEAVAVSEARTELHAVVEELHAIRSRPLDRCPRDERQRLRADLDELRCQCEQLSERRQSGDLGPDHLSLRDGTETSVNEYLYHSLSTQYPVLSAVATTVEHVVSIRRRLDCRPQSRSSSTRSTTLD